MKKLFLADLQLASAINEVKKFQVSVCRMKEKELKV